MTDITCDVRLHTPKPWNTMSPQEQRAFLRDIITQAQHRLDVIGHLLSASTTMTSIPVEPKARRSE